MDKAFINKIQQIVLNHLDDENLSVEKLAFEIGLSRTQLLRKVKASTGKTVSEYIREIRLKEASRLIKESDYTASEISYRVGFSSPSYFNKCFHDHFGVTPGDYKSENENSILTDKSEKSDEIDNTNEIQKNSPRRKKYLIPSLIVLLIIAFSYYFYTNKTFSFERKINKKTIAVLPFKDMSPEDSQWFCDGVTDNILSKLSQINGLTVISRTSSDTYRKTNKKTPRIAKELGVSYIIEGSVTKYNNEVKIIAQLINAYGEHIWSKEYTDSFEHIFTIQQNVAKQIAEQLQINLTMEEEKRIDYNPTDNLEALKLYQKGRLLADNRTIKDLESSIEFYQKAIELDPNYAQAYAEIANSYYIMDGFGQINRDKINSYIEKAFAINPNTTRAYTVKAMIYRKDEHWEKAKEYFEKALELNPNDAIAHHYYGIFLNKSPDRDIKNYLIHIDLAQKLDPLSTPINNALITALLTHYKVKEAEEHLKKVSFSLTDISKIGNKQKILNKKCEIVSLKKKDWTEAIRFYQKAIEEDPDYSFLYGELAFYYNVVLNDDKNRVKYRKKAYQLDSIKFLTAAGLYFSLIENEKFIEAERLVETKNYKSIVKERGKLFELHGSFCYYYFKKDYKKAQEILSKSLKNELYFDKMLVLAQLGEKKDVYQLLKDHNDMVNSKKALVFSILKERDSMYHYLNKISSVYIDSKWINGRTEFDPFRKEERYKAFLKKNYLPITHWNE